MGSNRHAALKAISGGGGGETDPGLGRVGVEGGKQRYRGVPSREEIPGVEDLEAWCELRGCTAA